MKEVVGVSLDAVDEHAKPITEIGTSRPSRRTTLPAFAALAASMALEGLRHPVLIMPTGAVLDGHRRISAALSLGWTTIPAREVRTIEDAVEAIKASYDELTMPRTIEEYVDQGLTIETLEHRDPGTKHREGKKDYGYLIGGALTTSGSTYKRARTVVQASRSRMRPAHVVATAKEALRQAEAGVITVSSAYNRVQATMRAGPQPEGLVGDGLPSVPPPSAEARSPKARILRLEWVRALNEKGATSKQIADVLGIHVTSLRKMARTAGIDITADVVLARQAAKTADPNKAVRVAIDDLDALVWSLDRLDARQLDPNDAAEWALMLTRYARALNRVSRKIKGVVA
jgi:hypothetical protein